jgi:CHAD domain-containing protein
MALDPDRIQKSVRELQKTLKKASQRSTPEVVHDLRTRIRRFETTVEALALDSKRNERRLLKRLGRIRKRAGKVRDLDVLTSDLAGLHIKEENNCLVQLFEYLGAERYKHTSRLVRFLRQDRAVLRKRLKRTSRRIERLLGKNHHASSPEGEAIATAMASAIELASELSTPVTLNRGNLHEFRLKVKQLLDVLQMSDDANHVRFVESLGKVKDAIGEWHDWEELIVIAARILHHGPSCRLLHEFRVVSSRKYECALSVASKMRQDYLKPADRSGRGRGTDKYKPVEPALKAVSSMAA